MHSLEREVVSIAQGVWSTVLGLELRRQDDGAGRDAGPAVVGSVTISGAFEGRVTLRCAAPLAARATSILFGVDPAAATPDLSRDVVGELTNVLGGNIKALLPGPSRLSLPTVVEESANARALDGEQESAVVADVAFVCDDDPLRVRVTCHGGKVA